MIPNRSEYPLTRFLGMLLTYKPERLATADADRAADFYGISRDHAAGYIAQQRELKGVVA